MDRPVLGDLRRQAIQRLKDAGIESAALDTDLLLCAAAGVDRAWLHGHADEPVDAEIATAFEGQLQRRLAREPVSRILGQREFYGISFEISPNVLDPRPDTETLVSAVLDRRGELPEDARIADLGTGSGCILLSLLHSWPQATGIGLDISEGALQVAEQNAALLGLSDRVRFIKDGWDGAVANGPFDVIVSNPPYIPSSDIDQLEPEVMAFDPRLALDGGEDGLGAYRKIIPAAHKALKNRGLLALEVGSGQADSVAGLMLEQGFTTETIDDLSGIARVILAHR